jgi:hypothetical protein
MQFVLWLIFEMRISESEYFETVDKSIEAGFVQN